MKTILTFFVFCFFYFTCSAQWTALNIGNVNASNFSDVYAITSDIVIVTGTNGTILKTTDGGATWQQKSSGTSQNLGKIQFPTSDIGYVIESSGKLLKTTNAGETWSSIIIEDISTIYSLSCVNENLIFLSCKDANSNSILLKSENGGISWGTIIVNNPEISLYDIQFFDGGIGYAKSDYYNWSESEILKTIDGGKNWIEIEDSVSPFSFINENTGFYYKYGLMKTLDGGNSFVQFGQSSYRKFTKMVAINENTVWAIFEDATLCGCGTRGLIRMRYTPENGYQEYQQNHSAYFSSVFFSNEKLGYAVGIENSKAKIWKNTQADLTLDAKEDEFKNSISIYPNPASDKITISLSNQSSKESTISISDMSGKLLYNQNLKNKNELTIDVRSFTKGTYILTIQNQKQSHSQKIIIK